jgi:predicted permease
MTGFWQDFSHGLRNLRRHPGFAVAAVSILGLTIGMNTSLFTLFSALALKPWAVQDPARVVRVTGIPQMSPAEYRYLTDHSQTFAGLVAFGDQGAWAENGEEYFSRQVSGNFFRVLGVEMAVGRSFRDDEDDMNAPKAVTVLDYGTWQRRYGGDPGIVGREIRVEGIPFTVIGVAPRSFKGTLPFRIDAWLPLASFLLTHPWDKDARDPLRNTELCCSGLAGRIAPGIEREQARAELTLLSRQFRASLGWPTLDVELSGTELLGGPRRSSMVATLGLIGLALTLVMLLACANVAQVLLARAVARRHEIAVRLTLGASRVRLVRQLLTEGLALALGAAGIGIALAFVLPGWIADRDGANALQVRPDAAVLSCAAVLSLVACVAFSLAPALHATRSATAALLKTSSHRGALQGALLAFQVAISIVLLSGAGLLTHAVRHARTMEPGFTVNHIMAVELQWARGFEDKAAQRTLAAAFKAELADAPDAHRRAFTSVLPLDRRESRLSISFRLPSDDPRHERRALTDDASGTYFGVLGVPLVAGRTFENRETDTSPAIVNEAMARQCWPGLDPLGQTLIVGKTTRTVVGVAKDTHTRDLDKIEPILYQPLRRGALPHVLVHDAGGARAHAIADLAKRLDPRIEARVFPLADNIDPWLDRLRYGAAIASGVGFFALTLAAIGLSGVFGYVVQQRTREIGIRIALGATRSHVLRLVFASSARALATGSAVGLMAAIGAAQLLRHRLYGLTPFDPIAYSAALLVLAVAGLLATYVPTRRAMAVDPAVALRYE